MTDDEKKRVLALSIRDQIIENFREHKEAIEVLAEQNTNEPILRLVQMMAIFIQAEIMPKVET